MQSEREVQKLVGYWVQYCTEYIESGLKEKRKNIKGIDKKEIYSHAGEKCPTCTEIMTPQPNPGRKPRKGEVPEKHGITAEHIVPRVIGGGNKRENLVAMCHHCNQSRNSVMIEFLPSIDSIRKKELTDPVQENLSRYIEWSLRTIHTPMSKKVDSELSEIFGKYISSKKDAVKKKPIKGARKKQPVANDDVLEILRQILETQKAILERLEKSPLIRFRDWLFGFFSRKKRKQKTNLKSKKHKRERRRNRKKRQTQKMKSNSIDSFIEDELHTTSPKNKKSLGKPPDYPLISLFNTSTKGHRFPRNPIQLAKALIWFESSYQSYSTTDKLKSAMKENTDLTVNRVNSLVSRLGHIVAPNNLGGFSSADWSSASKMSAIEILDRLQSFIYQDLNDKQVELTDLHSQYFSLTRDYLISLNQKDRIIVTSKSLEQNEISELGFTEQDLRREILVSLTEPMQMAKFNMNLAKSLAERGYKGHTAKSFVQACGIPKSWTMHKVLSTYLPASVGIEGDATTGIVMPLSSRFNQEAEVLTEVNRTSAVPSSSNHEGNEPIILSTDIKIGISNFSTKSGIGLPRDPSHLLLFVKTLLRLNLKPISYRDALGLIRREIVGMRPSQAYLRTMRQLCLCYKQEPDEWISETILNSSPEEIISNLHKYLVEERIPSFNSPIDVSKVNEYFHSIGSTYSNQGISSN